MDSSRSLWVTCAAGGFVQALKCYEGASLSVANPRRLETENRPPLLVERKTEQYLLKLFDHYFLNWGKMKHLKGKNLSNKPCTAL